jgi:hypothetical protein
VQYVDEYSGDINLSSTEKDLAKPTVDENF